MEEIDCTDAPELSFQDSKEGSDDFIKMVKEMRLEDALTDITIIVQGVKFHCHRLVLSARSWYFRAMFTSNMKESREAEVEIKDVSLTAMRLLLDFLYFEEITITKDNIVELYSASNMLEVEKVLKYCAKYLLKNLNYDNCLLMYEVGISLQDVSLTSSAKDFVLEKFSTICCNESFYKLDKSVLLNFIQDDRLQVKSEELVYKAVIDWINYDLKSRRNSLPGLLESVRLPLVSPRFLLDEIESNTLIKKSRKCDEFLAEARRYHMLPNEHAQMQSPRTKPRSLMGNKSKDAILLLGGQLISGLWSQVVRLYTPEGKLKKLSTIRKPRNSCIANFAVCAIGDEVFITGGNTVSDDASVTDTDSCCVPTMRVYHYCYEKWMDLLPLPRRLASHAMVAVDNNLYVVGGTVRYTTPHKYNKNMYIYNRTTKTWEETVELPPEFCGSLKPMVVAVGGLIYIIGGCREGVHLTSVMSYNTTTSTWNTINSLPEPRANASAAYINGDIYILGGSVGRIDILDVTNQHYNYETSDILGPCGITTIGNKIYCFGGETKCSDSSERTPFRDLRIYNTETNQLSTSSWKDLPEDVPATSIQCVTVRYGIH